VAISSTAEAPIIMPPPSDSQGVNSVSISRLRDTTVNAVALVLFQDINIFACVNIQ
jgi:hypothetical protein